MDSRNRDRSISVVQEKRCREICLNGRKGIWTLDELIILLQACEVKIRISMDMKKEDFKISEVSYPSHSSDPHNLKGGE